VDELREFVARAYKNPFWIVATALLVFVLRWGFSFLEAVPLRIEEFQKPLGRILLAEREQTLAGRIQKQALRAGESTQVVSKFIKDKGIFEGKATREDGNQCLESIENARYEQTEASAAVKAVSFKTQVLTNFQTDLKLELQCIETELNLMGQIKRGRGSALTARATDRGRPDGPTALLSQRAIIELWRSGDGAPSSFRGETSRDFRNYINEATKYLKIKGFRFRDAENEPTVASRPFASLRATAPAGHGDIGHESAKTNPLIRGESRHFRTFSGIRRGRSSVVAFDTECDAPDLSRFLSIALRAHFGMTRADCLSQKQSHWLPLSTECR
jgi:hypothetical protein